MLRYIHIAGADNVVVDAFSRLVERHPQDEVAAPTQLTALVIKATALHQSNVSMMKVTDLLPCYDRDHHRHRPKRKIKEVHNSGSP